MARSTARLLVVGLAVASSARAHQAPDLDANNRYLKVTLLPGKARLTVTVLYGERPGAAERRAMDASGDGTLDAAERAAFGAHAAVGLAPEVTVAGTPARGWRASDVGVGDPPATAGGAFAVDLTLEVPYPDPRAAEQTLTVDERAALPQPGEVELRIDESPGVRVVEAHLRRETAGVELRYAWQGNAKDPGERAVVVRFRVDEELRPRSRPWALLGVAVAVLAALAAWRLRQRKV